MCNFHDLIQSGFWVIPKITYANLCNPSHNDLIILVSSDPLSLVMWKGKEQKFEYLENEKSFLDEKKKC